MKNVLITGCAGFIGFHLCNSLLKSNFNIFGIDNLNDYYDVKLKKDRLKILKKNKKKFFFYRLDINNYEKLFKKLNSLKIDMVINLAAQAGVRYVYENPPAYFESNIRGFFNILELMRIKKINFLLYASTSSVYGNNKNPFVETQSTDSQIQFYAATKKCNEIIANSYHEMFKINSIGLRFFTVYGPWGRPDMSIFKFTKNILENKPISVFNNGNHLRDFTYVDDIVKGISLLIKSKPLGHNIFNIGNNNQVSLMELIKKLESCLSNKAKKKFLKMQKGDIHQTKSNTSKLNSLTGYQSSIDIDTGLKNFVNWFKEYYRV